VARSIVDWFANKENIKILNRLLSQVKIVKETDMLVVNQLDKFKNKTFVLTGTLSTMSRDEAKTKIRSLGVCFNVLSLKRQTML